MQNYLDFEKGVAEVQGKAEELRALGVIDTIVPEPLGGAQRDPKAAIASVGNALAAPHRERLH